MIWRQRGEREPAEKETRHDDSGNQRRDRDEGQGLKPDLVRRGVPGQRAAAGDLHPGRRPRGRLRGGRPVPQGAGGQPQGRRDGQAAAALAAGLLTGPGHRSRRKRSGAPTEITGAEPPFWMLPTAVRLGAPSPITGLSAPGCGGSRVLPARPGAAARPWHLLVSAGPDRRAAPLPDPVLAACRCPRDQLGNSFGVGGSLRHQEGRGQNCGKRDGREPECLLGGAAVGGRGRSRRRPRGRR